MFNKTLPLFLLLALSSNAQEQSKSNLRKRNANGDLSTNSDRFTPIAPLEQEKQKNQEASDSRGPDDRKLITGGSLADAEHFPYYAAYRPVTSNANDPKTYCGGVVISSHFILTAAHCVPSNPSEMYWSVLNTGSERFGTIYNAKRVYVHPHYYNATFDNDIALFEMAEEITTPYPMLSNSFLQKGSRSDSLTVIGMGDTIDGVYDSDSIDIKKAEYDYINTHTCREWLTREGKNWEGTVLQTYNSFCGFSKRNEGVCMGDSGGPLVREGRYPSQDVLEGIVSAVYGDNCGGDVPDVFVRVSAYYDWIKYAICYLNPSAAPFYMTCDQESPEYVGLDSDQALDLIFDYVDELRGDINVRL